VGPQHALTQQHCNINNHAGKQKSVATVLGTWLKCTQEVILSNCQA